MEDPELREQVETLLGTAVEKWNQGDLDGYMEVYLKSDFICLVTDEALEYGYHNIRAHYEKVIGKTDRLSCHIIEVLYLGGEGGVEYAHVCGQFTIANGELPEVCGNFTLLLMRHGGKDWAVFKDHST